MTIFFFKKKQKDKKKKEEEEVKRRVQELNMVNSFVLKQFQKKYFSIYALIINSQSIADRI